MQNELFGEMIIESGNMNMVSYVLDMDDMFYDVGFRVMKNQEKGSLLPCYKVLYNGKTKLSYFVGESVPIKNVLGELTDDYVEIVIRNLIRAFEEVRGNGFLNTEFIDNRLERVYVEKNTYVVKLVYLPLNMTSFGNADSTENVLRTQLIKVLQEIRMADSPRIKNIVGLLKDVNLSLSDIASRLGVLSKADSYVQPPVVERKAEPVMRSSSGQLQLATPNGAFAIVINKEEFIIGKSREKADGVIEGNPAISRVHCKIVSRDNSYFVVDMGSANGTFVNNQKIEPNRMVAISEGTRLKLANMELVVRR
ncbi:MAG: FHA domain-containing protein [Lachnospiraceae bacterium]|nr:FHA domain-containing protein [Lachnospiraceae bacterium]